MPARKDASQASRKKRLGRGLTSLMSSAVPVAVPPRTEADVAGTPSVEPPAEAAAAGGAGAADVPPAFEETAGEAAIRMLPVADVRPNPDQPRREFRESALDELADSIRTAGLMQPIVVRPMEGGRFEIVVGERRWRAAQRAGLDRLPAIVRPLDDQTVAEWALIENIQREDLNPLERADAFRRLTEEYGLTHQEVADRVGLNRSTVTNLLRLHELDPATQEAVRRGLLGQAQARALLAVTNLEARQQLARLAVREGWSVRTLERRASALAAPRDKREGKGRGAAAPHRADLERRLSEHLGTKVQVHTGKRKGSGRLLIDFYTFDQFEGLMQKLGFDTTEL